MTVCKRVHYWGRVQGVGFRYTTQRLAGQFQVTGYVKNLLDGQVELLVEGDDAEVKRFLEALAGRMAGYIKGHKIEDANSAGLSSFTIR
jgi:acylphosphatase